MLLPPGSGVIGLGFRRPLSMLRDLSTSSCAAVGASGGAGGEGGTAGKLVSSNESFSSAASGRQPGAKIVSAGRCGPGRGGESGGVGGCGGGVGGATGAPIV